MLSKTFKPARSLLTYIQKSSAKRTNLCPRFSGPYLIGLGKVSFLTPKMVRV